MISFQFTEENIRNLFGNEAAEDEDPLRLKEYYFKNDTYSQATAALSLRMLVGHKGIGKSALFQIAMAEDEQAGYLPILIKPDDIVGKAPISGDFFQQIRDWKKGLGDIIAIQILQKLDFGKSKYVKLVTRTAGKLMSIIVATLEEMKKDAGLSPVKSGLIDNFLKNQKINVYIDDLDRGWLNTRDDINRISTLINAVRDLVNENKGLCVRIALRSDVYFLFRTSDESTDKIEGSVIWYYWSNHEILVMLIKRIESFFGRSVDDRALLLSRQHEICHFLNSIFEARFDGVGKWHNAPMYRILMSLTRKRPRDLVKLCILSARRAYASGAQKIGTKHLQESFEEYSQSRVQDTINEYRSELPGIDRLIFGMKPSKVEIQNHEAYLYSTDRLLKKIESILEQGELKFASGKIASARELAQFLYKINFLTARVENSLGIQRKYFEENRYLQSQFADFGYHWEIHPAYRWALQPQSIDEIYRHVDLVD